MWDLPTIQRINAEAHSLAMAGLPEAKAMENLGIRVCGNLSRGFNERKQDDKSTQGVSAQTLRVYAHVR